MSGIAINVFFDKGIHRAISHTFLIALLLIPQLTTNNNITIIIMCNDIICICAPI